MTIAFSGICLHASSNRTGLSRLFVRYSAEQVFARAVSHSASGTEELIHLEERSLGSTIIFQENI